MSDEMVQAETSAWKSQVPVHGRDAIMAALRAAGLPLAASSGTEDADDSESERSAIVCVAAVREDGIAALIACPSGLIYRVEPSVLDREFWSFAVRFYYLVTGNLEDRRKMAELAGMPIPFKEMKGRSLSRKKESALSGQTLDALLSALGCSPARTPSLFD